MYYRTGRDAKYSPPPHQALFGAFFRSRCPTTGPSMSHMQAPLIIVCRTSQSPSTTTLKTLLMESFRVLSVSQINEDFLPINYKSTLFCYLPKH